MMREEINSELRELGSSLADKHVPTPFGVPMGYFAGTERTIPERAFASETEILLPSIGNPYSAPPQQYFDKLPEHIQQQLPKKQKKGLLISFNQVKWAAAAMVFIMVTVGGYQMFYNAPVPKDTYGSETLAAVPDNDIQEYLGDDTYIAMAKSSPMDKMDIPSADIVEYLDETGWDNETF